MLSPSWILYLSVQHINYQTYAADLKSHTQYFKL